MRIRALSIHLGTALEVGTLFQFGDPTMNVTTRFVASERFIRIKPAPTLSLSFLAADADAQSALWRDVRAPAFNGSQGRNGDWCLPAFFQNLLPEGVFRERIAELRGCSPNDHFELLAACGRDLAGAVIASPTELSLDDQAYYITQNVDSLEPSVVAVPMEDGLSLSGVQPKLGLGEEAGQFVSRTSDGRARIIGKLPVIAYPLMPEVEHLSLQLAAAAGASVCSSRLEPLSKLAVQHGYDLGEATADTLFLAVDRFDRPAGARIHCEDFAQVMGRMPEQKYSGSYLDIARILMAYPDSMGESAVHELLRRIMINQLLGNIDMHLKNIGLIYRDGRTPELSPFYDVVAYPAYANRLGHGLAILDHSERPSLSGASTRKPALNRRTLRQFCSLLGIPEKPAERVLRDVVRAAAARWPEMVQAAELTPEQKRRLLAFFAARMLDLDIAARTSSLQPDAAQRISNTL
jgi:serine/threonine-protein kinase HipA